MPSSPFERPRSASSSRTAFARSTGIFHSLALVRKARSQGAVAKCAILNAAVGTAVGAALGSRISLDLAQQWRRWLGVVTLLLAASVGLSRVLGFVREADGGTSYRIVHSRYNDDRNRPSLAQAFALNANGARLSVVVSHLKSKGSSCETDGDPNTGDGQGNCNLTRVNAAAALADWIKTDPTGSGDPDYLLVGDMNAYYLEDPIETFRSAGLVDLLEGQPNPYSFVFQGQSGAYDYAFATASLAPQVRGALEWHINVDEPPVLDYNLEFGRDPALFDPDIPYRASDHDPVIVGIDLAN